MAANFFGDRVQQAGFDQLVDLPWELETFENAAHFRQKCLQASAQVFVDGSLVAHQRLHIKDRRGVTSHSD